MDETPACSVVIPCRDHARELRRCLEALREQRGASPFEVIVVDAAEDSAVAAVAAAFPGVRLVRSSDRLSAGSARNLGARHARAAELAFTDADCVPEADWLACALAARARGARVVTGPVLDFFPHHPIAAADHLLQFAEFAEGRPESPALFAPGCNLTLGRDTFASLGRFDAVWGEDTLLTRAAAARWPGEQRFDPRVRVRHAGRRGLAAYWRHLRRLGESRGQLAVDLSPRVRRLARRRPFAIAFALRRVLFIGARTARWNPAALVRFALLLPILVVGLVGFGLGLARGCRGAPAERP